MRLANTRFRFIRVTLLTVALSVSSGLYANNWPEKWLPIDPLVKEWWQLYLSIPNSVREQLAEDPEACGLGQHGRVWFLATAGTPDQTTTRRCTVPHDALLFVPVVTAVCSPFPGETLEDNVQP